MERKIEVDTNMLGKDVASIQNEIRALRQESETLKSALTSLNSSWEGPAKTAFVQAVSDDLRQLGELIKSMESFTGLTDQARKDYDKCERTVGDIVSALRV